MTLTGAGKIAGVVGWPIRHSLSPLLHGYWLDELKVDGALVPLGMPREDFARTVLALRRAGFTGVNVTVPHKEAAFALAHVADAAAKMAGAANLLIFHPDGRIEGRNTDTVGLRESLRAEMGSLQGKTVLLLGAGGAARGALLALSELGAAKVHVLNRHADKLAFRVERAMEGPLAVVAEIGSASDSEGAGFFGGLLDLHLVGLERESVDRHLVAVVRHVLRTKRPRFLGQGAPGSADHAGCENCENRVTRPHLKSLIAADYQRHERERSISGASDFRTFRSDAGEHNE